MPATGPAGQEITRHLQEAIERLRLDLMKVELWAAALDGFQRPVPTYEPNVELMLPPHAPADYEKS